MKTLLIVDVQNDFMPKGALGVPRGDEIIPVINRLIPKFSLVLACMDWHPLDHMSFAKNHPDKKNGDIVDVKGTAQILWPAHCTQNSYGAELVEELNKEQIKCNFYKGTDKWIDSYSAFFDNAHLKSTGLNEYLISHHIQEIYIVGLATDYCILYSAIDAINLGYKVTVIADGCRAINLFAKDEESAYEKMREKGVAILTSNEIS